MSFVKEVSSWILQGINGIIQEADVKQIDEFINELVDSKDKRILVMGSGRSGFVARAFALRLMQSGFNVYVSGETITPALSPGDIVLAVSGSGTTKIIVTQAEIAKEIGATIMTITSQPTSQLAELSDTVLLIKGRTKEDATIDYTRRTITGEYDMAPLGTMFELSALILLDSIIAEIMKKLGKSELDLRKGHSHTQ
ncbi:SIS domain-containing protein [Candidatus Bathyarchaeota archaeon]|jgi:6-phospho-3-hexuloisomerase|nr:SIS domain-containing protein [Candidatus Bathyarchaeota archaeon]